MTRGSSSNSEINGWYTPGAEPIVFEVDGYHSAALSASSLSFPKFSWNTNDWGSMLYCSHPMEFLSIFRLRLERMQG